MKKRRIYFRPQLPAAEELTPLPERKSDNLLLVERLLGELLQEVDISEISDGAGVSVWTLRNLARGKSTRVTRQVLFAVQGLYNRWRKGLPLAAEAKAGRSGEEASADSAGAVTAPALSPAAVPAAPGNSEPPGARTPASFSGAINSRTPRGINLPAIEAEIERIEKRLQILNSLRDLVIQL